MKFALLAILIIPLAGLPAAWTCRSRWSMKILWKWWWSPWKIPRRSKGWATC